MAAERHRLPFLLAPDSFKGTYTAAQVSAALARGLAAGGVAADLCPTADGGEGTVAALLGVKPRSHTVVSDPLGRPITAEYGMDEGIAVLETAAASGLGLVSPRERHACAASTAGTGELINAAVAAGAHTVLLGAGGSATTDGGEGAIEAITAAGGLQGAKLIVLCDVRSPFEEAARVFAPQKGADPDAVRWLTERLEAQAARLPKDPRGVPMTGCAGGLAGGLWATFDAQLVPGASFVLDRLDFDRRSQRVQAVITGEGRLDDQSLAGKVVLEVARRARVGGLPCHAIVGSMALTDDRGASLGFASVHTASTLLEIETAARALAKGILR